MGIEITDIRIYKMENRGNLLAYANIVLNDSFIIRGIKLIETAKSGRFIAMPSRRLKGEKKAYRDLFHPLNSDVRKGMTDAIFTAYDKLD